jgi:hypothetical protein
VVIAATPKDAKFPLYDVRKNVKPKDGDLADVRLLRDGQPVAPLDRGHFGATIRADSARLRGDPTARQAVSAFAVDAFAPREDGTQPRLVVVVTNLAKGEEVSFALDRRTVEQVLRDFQVYLLTRRR